MGAGVQSPGYDGNRGRFAGAATGPPSNGFRAKQVSDISYPGPG